MQNIVKKIYKQVRRNFATFYLEKKILICTYFFWQNDFTQQTKTLEQQITKYKLLVVLDLK
jgi:hypothetical protein